jgi:hypothetical protein
LPTGKSLSGSALHHASVPVCGPGGRWRVGRGAAAARTGGGTGTGISRGGSPRHDGGNDPGNLAPSTRDEFDKGASKLKIVGCEDDRDDDRDDDRK